MLSERIKKLPGNEHMLCDSISDIIRRYDTLSEEYEIALAYGSLSLLDARGVRVNNLKERLTQIWICPQAAYMKGSIMNALSGSSVAVSVLDRLIFGTMDAEKAWKEVRLTL